MAASAEAGNARLSPAWIINRESDLLWLLGGVVVGYLFLAAHVLAGLGAGLLWWLWVIALDGPHIFATLSRTYLDRQERATRGPLLWWSLLWFLLGPACFALSALIRSRLPFGLFVAFANLWAYWHVVRQHYGILALYKRKSGDFSRLDRWLDSALLYGGLYAPFLSFALTHPQSRRLLGLPPALTWERVFSLACFAAVGLLALAFAIRQLSRYLRGEGPAAQKSLFFLAVVPLSCVVFSPRVVARADFLIFTIAVTAFHNVQYHALVWFYHRNRYGAARGVDFGWAARVGARFLAYAAAGVAFTLLYRALGAAFGLYPGFAGLKSAAPLAAGLTASDLVYGLIWGFSLHHYYLDQKIWRLRKDPALRRDLGLGGAQPSA